MKLRTRQMILIFMTAAGLIAADSAQPAKVMMEAARKKEVVDGDLKGAIRLYGEIGSRYKNDRAVAAMALVRMAEAYQKMGDDESRRIFERVVREYGDQKEAATLARNRLGGSATAAIIQRQVWSGPKVDVYGSISPDGRLLSFVDWANHGALGIHDLTTGSDRLLNSGGEAEYSAISKDGRLVAYSWFKRDVWRYEVRLANLTGDPKPRQLFDSVEVSEMSPYDWSPDGKWIAVGIRRTDHTAQIGLLSSETGALNVLKSADWRGPTRMFFSPDGRYLAYDIPAGAGEAQRDVYILAVDGSREIAAVIDPNQDMVMGWWPGMLLFASDRSGSMGLWGLPFQDGKVQGAPELLKSDLGTFESSLGISNSGSLYFGRTGQAHNIQVVPVDWTAGKLAGTPMDMVKRFVGSNYGPSWSSDGKFLGYVSLGGPTGANKVLRILNMETGKIEKEIRPLMSHVGGNAQLSPDGRTFLVDGVDLKGRSGIFLLDAETGNVKPIALSDEPSGLGRPDRVVNSEWSPDGKKVYFIKISGKGDACAFIEKDLASGDERELIRRLNLGVVSVSPDGRWLATAAFDSATASKSVLLIPLGAGGSPRELFRPKPEEDVRVQGWTPDSRAVLVSEIPAGAANQSRPAGQLWRLPVGEGAPRKLDIDLEGLHSSGPLRISPDGHYVAYLTAGASISQVSVLENFLPKTASK